MQLIELYRLYTLGLHHQDRLLLTYHAIEHKFYTTFQVLYPTLGDHRFELLKCVDAFSDRWISEWILNNDFCNIEQTYLLLSILNQDGQE